MPLTAGTHLGTYEVVALIGSGGMGEVYRATDTKLHRDVALKVLPPAVAHDADRLARFRREAHVLASLNHPHIATIHGFEDAGDTHALVMELVPGPTLADMIAAAGRLAVADALPIARQIAEALEAAHEQGVIHRDLKPANVKVRDDGTVKVLDFGLAKALEPAGTSSAGDVANSPTLTSPAMTAMGMILGTAAYMAPEQARGKPVDKRADIWAFGCVLYEMLTGRRVFDGEDISLALSQVLQREPDWSLLPSATPATVRRLLERCLDKDPKRRLRDIGEARLALDAPLEAHANAPAAAVPDPRFWQRPLPALVGALGLMALAATAAYTIAVTSSSGRSSTSGAPWDKFTQLTDDAGEETAPTLSPDGQSFAYASRARGTWDIYVRRVGGRNPSLVAGDPGREETAPTFSWDATRIAFHESDADGGIFIVGATGESPRRITAAGFHPAWSPDGRHLVFCDEEITTPYARGARSAIWIVDVEGGAPRKIFEGDGVQPVWSPADGRIAFWSQRGGQRDILTIAVAGGEPTLVTNDAPLDWSPAWSSDGRSLVFASDRGGTMNLWRIAIDESSGRGLGAPEPVTLGVQAAIARATLSRDGTKMLFQSTLHAVNPAALSFDPVAERLGPLHQLVRRTGILAPMSVSRDGQWLALSNAGERQEDIFVSRTDGSGLAKLTDDDARDRAPVWSPDGKELAFYSNRTGNYEIWLIGRDGLGRRQASAIGNGDLLNPRYSPLGDRMVSTMEGMDLPLYLFDPRRPWAEQTATQVTSTLSAGYFTRTDWSPDGRRLAVVLTDPSQASATLATINLESNKQTSVAAHVPGLVRIRWLPDGRRVIALFQAGHLAVYDVDSGRQRVLPPPPGMRLFPVGLAVSPDGRTLYVGVLDRESDIWMVEMSGAAGDAR